MTSVQERAGDSAVARFRKSLDRRDWTVIAAMGGFVLLLHVVGWGVLVAVVAPQNLALADGNGFGVVLGVTAYVLGMRHAFDADHIAAIDNTTRKLVADGKKPLTVGFWFSLGHSSVVFGLCLLLALGVRSLAGQVGDQASMLQQITGLVGTTVSGIFLILLGLVNLVSLIAILKVWRAMRRGHFDEVSLLVLAGASAAVALPWYAIMVLPVLFAAGMSLLDSIDGLFMNFAYGWAFSRPVRKVYYNMLITGLSVAVALIIGVIEIDSILVDKLGITSGPLHTIGTLDLNHVGYLIVALFVVTWVAALSWWRLGRVEERWSAGLSGSQLSDSQLSGSQAVVARSDAR
jgi:nickel/cobalt transporter (NiCoT) family protein